MNSARLLVILLLAATVLVDLVSLSVLATGLELPAVSPAGLPFLVVLSLARSQVILVAIWTGLGGRSLPWRTLALLLVIVLWAQLLSWAEVGAYGEVIKTRATLLALGLAARGVAILVPLMAARVAGLRLIRACGVPGMEKTVVDRPRYQFSVGYLLSWITVLAVALGTCQYTVDYRALWLPGFTWWTLAVLGLLEAALALVALWTALCTRRPVLRAAALAMTTGAVIVLDCTLFPLDPRCVLALRLLQILWLLASLWVFRVAGYRLVWRPGWGEGERPSAAVGR